MILCLSWNNCFKTQRRNVTQKFDFNYKMRHQVQENFTVYLASNWKETEQKRKDRNDSSQKVNIILSL